MRFFQSCTDTAIFFKIDSTSREVSGRVLGGLCDSGVGDGGAVRAVGSTHIQQVDGEMRYF
ncbi:MAG: hypothetical protein F6K41_03445 [Symploca sp. SIO3E6]|nr:hypothetical protein [Caldora sp. SIO3E6]